MCDSFIDFGDYVAKLQFIKSGIIQIDEEML